MTEINDIIYKIINFDYLWFLSYVLSLLTFETFLKLVVVYFFIVWIAIIIWVTRDIINRSNNILLQIFSILTVLVWTPLWIVVYLLVRPSQTLFEQYYEEASIDDEASLEENFTDEKHHCPFCHYQVESDYKYCPNCRESIKKECISCKKLINPKLEICPYCWEEQKTEEKEQKQKKKSNVWKKKIKIETNKENKWNEDVLSNL